VFTRIIWILQTQCISRQHTLGEHATGTLLVCMMVAGQQASPSISVCGLHIPKLLTDSPETKSRQVGFNLRATYHTRKIGRCLSCPNFFFLRVASGADWHRCSSVVLANCVARYSYSLNILFLCARHHSPSMAGSDNEDMGSTTVAVARKITHLGCKCFSLDLHDR